MRVRIICLTASHARRYACFTFHNILYLGTLCVCYFPHIKDYITTIFTNTNYNISKTFCFQKHFGIGFFF